MKLFSKSVLYICASLLLSPALSFAQVANANANAISAEPGSFLFQFEYPEWDTVFNSNAGLGTNPIVSVLVDNGNDIKANQTWDLLTDIVSVEVSADGGSYSNVWLATEIQNSNGTDFNYLSTDDDGLATLDLGPLRDSNIVFSNPSGTWQFGARSSSSGATQSWLATGPSFTGTAAFHSSDQGFSVVETVSVPEPSGMTLLLVSVCGFAVRRRR